MRGITGEIALIEVHAKLFLTAPAQGSKDQKIRVVMTTAMVEQPDVEVVLTQAPAVGEASTFEILERFIRQAFEAKERERCEIESTYL